MERRCEDLGGTLILPFYQPWRTVAGRQFGHTGFTGTSLWIDPATKTYIVLLTNAVHMNALPAKEKGSAVSLRTKVATAVAAALALDPAEAEKMRLATITGYNEMQSAARKLAVRNGTVKTGIDVLEETKFAALHPAQGRRSAKHRTADESDRRGLAKGAGRLMCWPTCRGFRWMRFSARSMA